MPNYSYRCEQGCAFDAAFTMASVPDRLECPTCQSAARRIITAPHLAATGSAAFKTIDSAARSAHEPAVVQQLPGAGRKRRQPVTHNPLHAKLPRT